MVFPGAGEMLAKEYKVLFTQSGWISSGNLFYRVVTIVTILYCIYEICKSGDLFTSPDPHIRGNYVMCWIC